MSGLEMFNRSHNNIFHGGNFNNIGRDLIYFSSEDNERGLRTLLQYASTSATYNAEARFPPPLCHPGTRKAILDNLKDWARSNEPDDAIRWLYGPAGAGKSAIAQTFAEACARNGTLVGSFFFWRTDSSRNNPQMLFTTIAYQMAMSFAELRPIINAAVINDFLVPTSFIESQFNVLILQPLVKAQLHKELKSIVAHMQQGDQRKRGHSPSTSAPRYAKRRKTSSTSYSPDSSSSDRSRPCILIIDGLDECSGSENQRRILCILAGAMQKYNLPLRILVASRPERLIKESFRSANFENICHWMPLNDTYQASLEIRKYLQDRFCDILMRHSDLMEHVPRPWPTSRQIEHLVQKASGQFIYPSTVLKYIDDGSAVPADRLNIVLGLSTEDYDRNDSPFTELDALYCQILTLAKNHTMLPQILGAIIVFKTSEKLSHPPSQNDYTTPSTSSPQDFNLKMDMSLQQQSQFTDLLPSAIDFSNNIPNFDSLGLGLPQALPIPVPQALAPFSQALTPALPGLDSLEFYPPHFEPAYPPALVPLAQALAGLSQAKLTPALPGFDSLEFSHPHFDPADLPSELELMDTRSAFKPVRIHPTKLLDLFPSTDLGKIRATFSGLHSLFKEPSPVESDFQFCHASFTDFLLDRHRSLDFSVDRASGHDFLAQRCLDIQNENSAYTLAALHYAQKYWAHHCINASGSDKLLAKLAVLDVFSVINHCLPLTFENQPMGIFVEVIQTWHRFQHQHLHQSFQDISTVGFTLLLNIGFNSRKCTIHIPMSSIHYSGGDKPASLSAHLDSELRIGISEAVDVRTEMPASTFKISKISPLTKIYISRKP
ncbi:hypothetical protein BDP27DRAFT_1297491 [Rhodocollybia butyracea]|uniref:Nephrocystin 3-like N-terminal domain-containing protein n=1 Tax=Rhodocollybia butyracea TaxID=206335 RepID=A0A9P5U4V0_9AGAR|nr:hypothetical protein BDP27DRAFT_1297491 [Rhodocollybia butyracea]